MMIKYLMNQVFACIHVCKNSFCASLAFVLAWFMTPTMLAQSSNTQYGTANGINDLPGIEPSKDYCTTGRPTNDASKQFCFYNLGTGQFLSIGGLWGTHASINTTPFAIWFESAGTDGKYYLNCKVDGSGTGTYLGTKNATDLWMDQGKDTKNYPKATFSFEHAEGYTDKNKVFLVKVTDHNKTSYMTTFPDNKERLCNITTTAYATTYANYKNQVWKIISKQEYYTLALANPATMKSIIDFSFLITDAGFRINNTDAAAWHLKGSLNDNTDKVKLGDTKMYCLFSKRGSNGTGHFNQYIEDHQKPYGKYAYCYSQKVRDFMMYQDIKVHKAGWYVIRCNGFSTQQSIQGESKPLAYLFVMQQVKQADGTYAAGDNNSSATLNVENADHVATLASESDGAGIGVAFFNGRYENQVQLCVEQGDDTSKPISKDNPATLRLGYYVDKGSTDIQDDEMTAVDNFKLLYAGPRRNPELILDEENTDLLYLTKAKDEYTNTVLHLNRKLNAHQWNSFILPVNLTLGQMKRTYGDAVKVAKLDRISNGTVYFVTQEPASDDSILVRAFEPYIVYPPVVDVTSGSYTVNKFYTSADASDNSEWLDTDYNPTSDASKALTKTIAKDHNIITMVSLDRSQLLDHVEKTKKGDLYTWISNTSFSTGVKEGEMTCYGTLAKTYDENGILPGRDDLEKDYCMRNGNLVQVPMGKQYGLQGFRCWFEIYGTQHGTPSGAKLSLNIDGIGDNTTSIRDICADEATFTSKDRGIDGVFSLDGQMVRRGSSLEGLPKGIYITDGRKVVVR